MKSDVTIMDFTGIYEKERFYRGVHVHWIDCRDIQGTNCYCDEVGEQALRRKIAPYSAEAIHFIDSGNYHYMTKLWMEKLREPFVLAVADHHPDMLFQAQGSVLENFRSEYTDLMTRTISVFFQGMKQKYPHINIAITNFFIHLNTVWLFALLEELVLHPVKKEEMEKFIAEYIVFETAGWKELMNA